MVCYAVRTHAPGVVVCLLRKSSAVFRYIITMRDMLLVCSFLAVQRHVLSYDGVDLRIHVTLVKSQAQMGGIVILS
jgi:hypothetical protein